LGITIYITVVGAILLVPRRGIDLLNRLENDLAVSRRQNASLVMEASLRPEARIGVRVEISLRNQRQVIQIKVVLAHRIHANYPTIFDQICTGNRTLGKVYCWSGGGLDEFGGLGYSGSKLDIEYAIVDYDAVPVLEKPSVYFGVGDMASISFGIDEIDGRVAGRFGAHSWLEIDHCFWGCSVQRWPNFELR
jgi:hypothetical protein